MADMVGKNYATGEPVTVAVDENGVVQVATAVVAASAQMEAKLDALIAKIDQLQTTLDNQ